MSELNKITQCVMVKVNTPCEYTFSFELELAEIERFSTLLYKVYEHLIILEMDSLSILLADFVHVLHRNETGCDIDVENDNFEWTVLINNDNYENELIKAYSGDNFGNNIDKSKCYLEVKVLNEYIDDNYLRELSEKLIDIFVCNEKNMCEMKKGLLNCDDEKNKYIQNSKLLSEIKSEIEINKIDDEIINYLYDLALISISISICDKKINGNQNQISN